MNYIKMNPNQITGTIKPMHCTSGGPLKSLLPGTGDNRRDFAEIGFPYIRNHDASYCSNYGGEHIVDISAIFPDFEKDPYDENSYDFVLTDEYVARIIEVGSMPFYRLGQKIEHWSKKYGSHPPKDFKKWAVICEHIIKHYNEGWNNGFRYGLKYWEIWCEPDNVPACWTGTMKQYYDLYEITAKHLKSCFPDIKVGGASFAQWSADNGAIEQFIEYMSKKNVPIDFLSWHTYSRVIEDFTRREKTVREALDKFGYYTAENILNEWNYLINWKDGLAESHRRRRTMEGAAFVCALMSVMQNTSTDMLMYYLIQPGSWDGVFDIYTLQRLKTYYSFLLFSKLYKLQEQIKIESDDQDIYVIAATDRQKVSAMITYYAYDDRDEEKKLTIDVSDKNIRFNVYLLDEGHDVELVDEMCGNYEFVLKPNSVIYLEQKCN